MTIRTADHSDIDFFVECVTREGWLSETRQSFENFLSNDPQGCFVAEENGQRVGMVIATAYDTCGFLGELIVLADRRNRGTGAGLMKHALGYLARKGIRSVYLDADTQAIPLYERLGFRVVCKSLRFLGQIQSVPDGQVRRMTGADLNEVARLDRSSFRADRSSFLERRLLSNPELCHVIDREGIAGYIMGQPGQGVVTAGPWYAPDESVDPLPLLAAAGASAPQSKLRVGVLESNITAVKLMRSLSSFAETEPSRRMVFGPDIGLGVSSRLLAIATPATG